MGDVVHTVCEGCPVGDMTPADRTCKDCKKPFCDEHLNEWSVCGGCWRERRPVAFFARVEVRRRGRHSDYEWWFAEVKKKGDFVRADVEPFMIERRYETGFGVAGRRFVFDVEEVDPEERTVRLAYSETASRLGPLEIGLRACGFSRIVKPADLLKCDECGTRELVISTIDPKAAELDDVELPMNLCSDCYDERKGDV